MRRTDKGLSPYLKSKSYFHCKIFSRVSLRDISLICSKKTAGRPADEGQVREKNSVIEMLRIPSSVQRQERWRRSFSSRNYGYPTGPCNRHEG